MYKMCIPEGYDAQAFVFLHLIVKCLSLRGLTFFSSNACASGLYSLDAAAKEIMRGTSRAALVVAADHPRYFHKFMWFKQQGLYAKNGRIKPFDRHRDGFVIGDGATAVILESLKAAKKRGAQIYAEYLGGGFQNQAWKMTVPDPTSLSYELAIRQSLQTARIDEKDIDLVVPHGVGTASGDAYEAAAINRVFKKVRSPLVTALKPFVGHNLGGSALLETALSILSMQNSTILPTLNCEEPDERLKLNLVLRPRQHKLDIVLKCASGFGGYDSAIILKNLA